MKESMFARRSLLAFATFGALAATLPSSFGGEGRRRLDDKLISIFSHQESARVVGLTYLSRRPQEASRDALLAHLSRDLNLRQWLARGGSLQALRQCIRRRAWAEMRKQQSLRIAGYQMSVTELRLCALISLTR